MEILLTKSTTPIIGWIAWFLGWIMNYIYEGLMAIGIPNIGLAIILYTIIVYILMTPIQIKQQKMSKMMAIVQPEVNAVMKKYQGKTDFKSRELMQQEQMAIYEKYGYSPTGSCLPLMIQMPLLFALYQVIYRIPGYIIRIGNIYTDLATEITKVKGYNDLIANFVSENKVRLMGRAGEYSVDRVKDFLHLLKPAQWVELENMSQFAHLKADMVKVAAESKAVNSFLGLNISESPMDAVFNGFHNHHYIIIVIAILIPVLAWFTQWLNFKLMPQQAETAGSAANTMQTMNNVMPLFSAVMCATLSTGIGIYWIAGAVIRCIQQVVINRRISNMDVDKLIEKSRAKAAKKKARKGNVSTNVNSAARQNVKKVSNPKYSNLSAKEVDYSNNAKNARPDSITAKANMVKNFNERNNKR